MTAAALGESIARTPHEGDELDAFVRTRLELQRHIKDLNEAHAQGLAIDMAIAAERIDRAVIALAAGVHRILVRARGFETQIRIALYECDAVRDTAMTVFSDCLRVVAVDVDCRNPFATPAERYPWLRERLAECAERIDSILSMRDLCSNPLLSTASRTFTQR
jgi:hypothetical protein